jgi:hypothetical protein
MLRASFKPASLLDFFMLRVVNRAQRSATPTWSMWGMRPKSGMDGAIYKWFG